MKFKTLKLFSFLFFLWGGFLESKIYLDHEKEPWPLVSLEIVIPYGSSSKDAVKQVAGIYVENILRAGSKKLNKQQFTDKLSSFGADLNYSVGSRYTTVVIDFPYIEEKDYTELARLIRENLEHPRLSAAEFNLSEKKLRTQIMGALDNDQSLLSVAVQRWIKAKKFQFAPLTIDTLKKIKLSHVETFIKELLAVENIWVGYLGSEKAYPIVEQMIRAVFKKQGSIQKGKYLQVLKSKYAKVDAISSSKEFIIVDKKGLNQSMFTMYAIHPDKSRLDQELLSRFTHYILSGRSLDSILASEVRKKRGLAYYAAGIGREYYDFPLFGVISNPQRKRQKEAIEVFAMLSKELYEKGKLVADIADKEWGSIQKSFRYGHILDNSTPSKRLSMRGSVVRDQMSRRLYHSNPSSWRLTKKEVIDHLTSHWRGAARVLGVLGDSKELLPLIKKNFPEYRVQVIPYKKVVYSQTFQK